MRTRPQEATTDPEERAWVCVHACVHVQVSESTGWGSQPFLRVHEHTFVCTGIRVYGDTCKTGVNVCAQGCQAWPMCRMPSCV